MLLSVIVVSGNIQLNPGSTTGSSAAAVAVLQFRWLPAFDLLTLTMLQRITTPSDKYCLFQAISLSLKHLHSYSLSITQTIINLAQSKLWTHSVDYLVFGFKSENSFHTQIHQYLMNRRYDFDIGNLGPLAVANALSIRLYIVDQLIPIIYLHACVSPHSQIDGHCYILLHYHADNYNAVNIVSLNLT